jgi:MFS family permease
VAECEWVCFDDCRLPGKCCCEGRCRLLWCTGHPYHEHSGRDCLLRGLHVRPLGRLLEVVWLSSSTTRIVLPNAPSEPFGYPSRYRAASVVSVSLVAMSIMTLAESRYALSRSDRYGRRFMLCLCMFLFNLPTMPLIFTGNMWAYVVLRPLGGVTTWPVWSAAYKRNCA